MKYLRNQSYKKEDYAENKGKFQKTPTKLLLLVAALSAIIIIIFISLSSLNGFRDPLFSILAPIVILTVIIFNLFLYLLFKKSKSAKRYKMSLIEKKNDEYVIVDKLSVKSKESVKPLETKQETKKEEIKHAPVNSEFKNQTLEKLETDDLAVVTSFQEFALYINEYFAHKGVKTTIGNSLTGTLVSGPIAFLKYSINNDVFIDNLCGCFNIQNLIIDAQKYDSICDDSILYDAINAAKSFKNESVVCVIKNLKSKKCNTYLNELLPFLTGTNKHALLNIGGNQLRMPKNLHFIIALRPNDFIFRFNFELVKNSTVLDFDYENIAPDGLESKPLDLSKFNMSNGLNRIKNEEFLEEIYWKKVDAVEDLFARIKGSNFDNKLLLNLEGYVAMMITHFQDQKKALDYALAYLILPSALVGCTPDNFAGDNNIKMLIENLLDDYDMTLSKDMIDYYFDSFVAPIEEDDEEIEDNEPEEEAEVEEDKENEEDLENETGTSPKEDENTSEETSSIVEENTIDTEEKNNANVDVDTSEEDSFMEYEKDENKEAVKEAIENAANAENNVNNGEEK